MPKYGGQGIYGPVSTLISLPSMYGKSKAVVCPTLDCSQLQTLETYIVQITNILGNLDRNKKLTIADTALDRMTADINAKIAAAK